MIVRIMMHGSEGDENDGAGSPLLMTYEYVHRLQPARPARGACRSHRQGKMHTAQQVTHINRHFTH